MAASPLGGTASVASRGRRGMPMRAASTTPRLPPPLIRLPSPLPVLLPPPRGGASGRFCGAKASNSSSQDIDGFINVSEKVTCPKAVESTYDTWAESYEEDTSDQLGFTSPMVRGAPRCPSHEHRTPRSPPYLCRPSPPYLMLHHRHPDDVLSWPHRAMSMRMKGNRERGGGGEGRMTEEGGGRGLERQERGMLFRQERP